MILADVGVGVGVRDRGRTKVGDKSLTAKEGGLTRTMKSSFSDLCIKYDDIRNVDRMAAVQASLACC